MGPGRLGNRVTTRWRRCRQLGGPAREFLTARICKQNHELTFGLPWQAPESASAVGAWDSWEARDKNLRKCPRAVTWASLSAEDEVDMLNDAHGSEERTSVPSCYGGIGAPVSRQVPVFHDSELMATMTRKVQNLERQMKTQTDEMLSKDRKIRALEELVETLQEHQGQGTLQRQEELETRCAQLQRQVTEMERFLGDYGLQWVGEPMDQEDSEDKTDSEDGERDWMTAKKFWKPGDSLVPPEVDFDRLLASLKDLLVVDSETQVTPVPGRVLHHGLEPIPLKLYRNGIMMFDGPFRPFCDPSTQVGVAGRGDSPVYPQAALRCLREILDGFFPAELQQLYPDGVPFKVSDLRNQVYPENGLDLFPGEGRVVGWQRIQKPSDKMEHPGSRMTAEKFLNRLPKCVIRQGEVIDVRGPIWDALQVRLAMAPPAFLGGFTINPSPAYQSSGLSGGSGLGPLRIAWMERALGCVHSIGAFQNCCPLPARIQEIVVETPALAAERERSQESPESPAPRLSMLRIKSENGEQAFLLLMRPEDTVGDLRALLAQARAVDAATFEIFSTFPPTVYHDDALTLQAAGLVPNVALLLRARQAPLPAPGPE
ncbi:UBX domain-containing protein 11 [Camelus dromedarius]|uniref:UBX domain-containing protein 11 n=1 Tax=Camelus dromedarius TaxID=9838 RepID=A0A5N4DBY4_CAMDR|nr:UBX domain-containing protein 11 [Camelus dromedarius]